MFVDNFHGHHRILAKSDEVHVAWPIALGNTTKSTCKLIRTNLILKTTVGCKLYESFERNFNVIGNNMAMESGLIFRLKRVGKVRDGGGMDRFSLQLSRLVTKSTAQRLSWSNLSSGSTQSTCEHVSGFQTTLFIPRDILRANRASSDSPTGTDSRSISRSVSELNNGACSISFPQRPLAFITISFCPFSVDLPEGGFEMTTKEEMCDVRGTAAIMSEQRVKVEGYRTVNWTPLITRRCISRFSCCEWGLKQAERRNKGFRSVMEIRLTSYPTSLGTVHTVPSHPSAACLQGLVISKRLDIRFTWAILKF
ncbi:hypothetical protein C0J52_17729 [Blattella germanica]|nr:hypothetical protein C0J52_17729 [Blattella germanica]